LITFRRYYGHNGIVIYLDFKRRSIMLKHPLVRYIVAMLVFLALVVVYTKVRAQEMEKYAPLSYGVCEDVKLPCVFMMLKDTPFFYAVIKDGKIIAITKLGPDGKEITIWGKLPLKTNEQDI